MGYYDSEENIKAYIQMAQGYDGAKLIAVLKEYLSPGATLLELGIGPGKDLDMLRALYQVTGSDNAQPFIDLYERKHQNADVILIDAVTLDTDRKFDCIYSNKVLHHLTKNELQQSFRRQKEVLTEHGLSLHSFWYGSGQETHHELLFTYYTELDLRQAVGKDFDILRIERYQEMEENDSIYILLKKNSGVVD